MHTAFQGKATDRATRPPALSSSPAEATLIKKNSRIKTGTETPRLFGGAHL